VFTGLTAYDAQRLKHMALAMPSGQIGSYAIVGALTLYLDFINLFLMLLRFTGAGGTEAGVQVPERTTEVHEEERWNDGHEDIHSCKDHRFLRFIGLILH
jgi:hypothetical protein